METKNAALLSALDQLAAARIEHWICNGTLLGLARDGHLIPWDNDIDIAIPGEVPKNQVNQTLTSNGFRLLDDGGTTDYLTYDWNGVRVDINFFFMRDGELTTLWRVPKSSKFGHLAKKALSSIGIQPENVARLIPSRLNVWTLEGYSVRPEDTFPLGKMHLLDRDIPVPANVQATLAHIYGDTWHIPKKDYDWRVDGANNAYGPPT